LLNEQPSANLKEKDNKGLDKEMKYETFTQERVFDKISFASILNVHEKNEEGETPLHIASNQGQIELVASLIERGAELNTANNLGYTPLHYAASKCNKEIVRMLIDNGANVNSRSDFGYTPLHYAVNYCKMDIAKMLIDNGANINIRNIFGNTPLHCVAALGKMEAVRLLIEYGASLYLEDESEYNALQLARNFGYTEVADAIEHAMKNSHLCHQRF